MAVWNSVEGDPPEICWNKLEDFPRFGVSSTPIGSWILNSQLGTADLGTAQERLESIKVKENTKFVLQK